MTLPCLTESRPELAAWLGVDEVMLVREDQLPERGGKKRRSLARFAATVADGEEIHLLSYAGSHTAFTLAQLLPDNPIVLYGTDYGGGPYQHAMMSLVDQAENVTQMVGPTWNVGARFLAAQARGGDGQTFLRFGGSMGQDPETVAAAVTICGQLGDAYHHVVAVASGDLFRSVESAASKISGVLTQPLLVRLSMFGRSKNLVGLRPVALAERVDVMTEIRDVTGELWDPVFMGSVFHYLRQQRGALGEQLCIWVTCPAGVDWLAPSAKTAKTGSSR